MNPKPPAKVLFLCTGNSARSVMAEYLLRVKGRGRFETYSAGAIPTGKVNPLTLWVLKQHHNIDAGDARSKSWDELKHIPFDFVITVCDQAKESCPIWPGQPIVAHWGSPDPAALDGTEGVKKQLFYQVAAQIARRVDLFCALPENRLRSLHVQQIGEQYPIEGEAKMQR